MATIDSTALIITSIVNIVLIIYALIITRQKRILDKRNKWLSRLNRHMYNYLNDKQKKFVDCLEVINILNQM